VTVRFRLAMTVPSREERTADLFRDAADEIERQFEQMERESPTTEEVR
jgi:hypothetical protein